MARIEKSLSLETEPTRTALIRELALSEKSQRALAADYGVSQGAVSFFRKRHEEEIAGYRGAGEVLEGEVVKPELEKFSDDLWITNKERRLRALQDDVEILEGSDDVEDIKARLAIFKMVEDSLGQAEPKMTVNVAKQVHYEIKGINLEDLA